MVDITKCPGYYIDSPANSTKAYEVDCKKRDTCYRYTATPDPLWQSWMDYPYSARAGECELYLRTRNNAPNSAVR